MFKIKCFIFLIIFKQKFLRELKEDTLKIKEN